MTHADGAGLERGLENETGLDPNDEYEPSRHLMTSRIQLGRPFIVDFPNRENNPGTRY